MTRTNGQTDGIPVCQPPATPARAARFRPPAGACDCHMHVFEDPQSYPLLPGRDYTPAPAPEREFRKVMDRLGLDRAVLVQPSVYGFDNRLMLHHLAAAPERYRGVAVVPEDVTEQTLGQMHAAGVRGIRANLLYSGGNSAAQIRSLAGRIAPLGWHLQVLMDVSVSGGLIDELSRLPVPVVFDHMGNLPAARGTEDPGFRAMLKLLGSGRGWVKLSGCYRNSAQDLPPYDDTLPFARRLIETNPERLVWASDWPNVNIVKPMPNASDLLDFLDDAAPDAATRDRILSGNAAELYDFPRPAQEEEQT